MQTHYTQCTNTTHLQRRHMCTCTTICTHTRMGDRSCSLVCMDVCTCVYVCHKRASMCTCVCISMSHMYTLTQTRHHTIPVCNMHGKRHMCKCTMTHTKVSICALQCICVYACIYLYHTSIHWHRCTIHNTRIPRTCKETHVYIYHNSYAHAHERSLT